MLAKKQQLMRSHYSISVDQNKVSKKEKEYMGSLCSNLLNSEFNLFGVCLDPNKRVNNENIRSQHASIIY